MGSFREGTVIEVLERRDDLVTVSVDAGEERALIGVGWPAMLGPVDAGDRIVVNTTGIDLGLGTGETAFILWNLDGEGPGGELPGHIVKMRYTPWQTAVLAAEAPESPHHHALSGATSIDGMPVVACGLHSQIAGVAGGIKAAVPDARVGYLMTDGAALPISWSGLARSLKAAGLVHVTCTSGHAFGGDLESVNVFSGLAALRHAASCDVAIVAMGPGLVGTGTALGFTALETGTVLDAAGALGGGPIACLRICFSDERDRHRGLSHHSITALTLAAQRRATVVVPELPGPQRHAVEARLGAAGIATRHEVVVADGSAGLDLLRANGLSPASMGRPMDEIPELFLAGAAAGRVAASRM